MRKLLVLVVLAGCAVVESQPGDGSGSGAGSQGPDDSNLTPAQRAWVHEALPVLTHQCGNCHFGTGGAPGFLSGETEWDQRANLLASGLVNLDDPASSRLLTKGGHSGPGMNATSASVILSWIEAERDERL